MAASSVGNEPLVLMDFLNVEGQKTVWDTVFPTHAVQAFDGVGGVDDLPELQR